MKKIAPKYIPVLITAAVLVVAFVISSFVYSDSNFGSYDNILNIFRSNAVLGIVAIGMTFVILSGGIDLSVGAVVGFSSILTATMITNGYSPATTWPLVLLIGLVIGLAVGLLIECFDLPPFLVTLAALFFMWGMSFCVHNSTLSIKHNFYDWMQNFPYGSEYVDTDPNPFTFPIKIVFYLSLLAVALVIAHFTRFGRNIYALGSNRESAFMMGLPVMKTSVLAYVISGFCSALAGIVLTIDQGGSPNNGVGMELDAIAAVVIGGTLLTGGVGFHMGTLLGVLIYGTIQAILDADGTLDAAWLKIIIGVLLLLFILMQNFITPKSKTDHG